MIDGSEVIVMRPAVINIIRRERKRTEYSCVCAGISHNPKKMKLNSFAGRVSLHPAIQQRGTHPTSSKNASCWRIKWLQSSGKRILTAREERAVIFYSYFYFIRFKPAAISFMKSLRRCSRYSSHRPFATFTHIS